MADLIQSDEHDLERQKFALEKCKLKLELQKYDDDKATRDLAREKAQEELRDLKKPWWKKPAYLSPMATIMVAIVGGLIAFGTDALKSNLPRLLSERQELSKKNMELRSKSSQLSDQIKAARGQIAALKQQKEALAEQLPLDRFQALIAVIERKAALEPLQLDDPAFRDAYKAATDGGPGSEVVRTIERKRADASYPPSLRAGFAFILYKVNHDLKYKQTLATDSLRSFSDVVSKGWIRDRRTVEPYVTMLADPTIFDLQERIDHLRTMFALVDMSDPANTTDYTLIHVLATSDDDSVLRFRDPWIE